MARTFIGYEVPDRSTAEAVIATFPNAAKAGPPRILRLRDRAAPSGYAPLAVVLDLGQRLAALEADMLDLRTRVGDLEREPDESPISEAARKGALEAGEPVRPEPSVADPGRLAKAVEPTDGDLGRLVRGLFFEGENVEPFESLPDDTRNDYTRAGKAIYTLGREHGSKDRAALLARAEKAERESTICLACAASGAASRPLPALRPTAHVPVESAGADGARLALSEAEMAAELREAGWTPSAMTGRWYLPIGSAGGDGGRVIADAHAAMRAAKGAR